MTVTVTVGSGTVTIPAAETLSSTGDPLAYFSANSGGTLVNDGVMSVTTTGAVSTGPGGFPGIVSTYDEPDPSALFENNGQFTANVGDSVVGVNFATLHNAGTFSLTSGAMATGGTGGLVNSGSFTVQGGSDAYGIQTYNPDSWGGLVQNQAGGAIEVTSQGTTYGVEMANGGEVDNAGQMTVSGQGQVYGVAMNNAYAGGYSTSYALVDNSGSIDVAGGTSFGVSLSGGSSGVNALPAGDYNIVNSGTISAQTAIDLQSSGAINNSGTLNGDVLVADNGSGDALLNTGKINGNVVFGDGNDLIDSSQGTITGTITVGAGNDTINAGAENDTIHLGNGNDTVDGGAGFNIVELTNFDETKVALTHVQGAWVLDAGGVTDTLSHIQEVVFANGAVTLPSGAAVAELADFTGSGHSGILWQDTAGDVSTWNVTGSTTLNMQEDATYNSAPGGGWQLQGTMDFTGDGQSDLVWRNSSSGQIALWHEASPGVFSSEYVSPSIDTGWSVAALGDFSGDGNDDMLLRRADGTVVEWRSTGSGFTQNTFGDTVSPSWHIQGVGDFNGDGAQDVLWRNADGSLSVWSGGANGFSENSYYHSAVPTSWHVAGTGDFNGDGKADILWWNDSGAVSVWSSTGSGFTENTYYNTVGPGWSVVGAFDFNGDGKADILWHNASSGQISIWESTGSGFTAAYTGAEASYPGLTSTWTPFAMHYDIV